MEVKRVPHETALEIEVRQLRIALLQEQIKRLSDEVNELVNKEAERLGCTKGWIYDVEQEGFIRDVTYKEEDVQREDSGSEDSSESSN